MDVSDFFVMCWWTCLHVFDWKLLIKTCYSIVQLYCTVNGTRHEFITLYTNFRNHRLASAHKKQLQINSQYSVLCDILIQVNDNSNETVRNCVNMLTIFFTFLNMYILIKLIHIYLKSWHNNKTYLLITFLHIKIHRYGRFYSGHQWFNFVL